MQLNLNRALAEWIDSERGELSRQQYITQVLRMQMKLHSTLTGNYGNETNNTNGTIKPIHEM